MHGSSHALFKNGHCLNQNGYRARLQKIHSRTLNFEKWAVLYNRLEEFPSTIFSITASWSYRVLGRRWHITREEEEEEDEEDEEGNRKRRRAGKKNNSNNHHARWGTKEAVYIIDILTLGTLVRVSTSETSTGAVCSSSQTEQFRAA